MFQRNRDDMMIASWNSDGTPDGNQRRSISNNPNRQKRFQKSYEGWIESWCSRIVHDESH